MGVRSSWLIDDRNSLLAALAASASADLEELGLVLDLFRDVCARGDHPTFRGTPVRKTKRFAVRQAQIEGALGVVIIVEEPCPERLGIFERAERAALNRGIDDVGVAGADTQLRRSGREEQARSAVAEREALFCVVQSEPTVEAFDGSSAPSSLRSEISLARART